MLPINFFQVEDIHLVREEDTGKSRGFAFVKYEDSRSCILAVDNFIGVKASIATILSRRHVHFFTRENKH